MVGAPACMSKKRGAEERPWEKGGNGDNNLSELLVVLDSAHHRPVDPPVWLPSPPGPVPGSQTVIRSRTAWRRLLPRETSANLISDGGLGDGPTAVLPRRWMTSPMSEEAGTDRSLHHTHRTAPKVRRTTPEICWSPSTSSSFDSAEGSIAF